MNDIFLWTELGSETKLRIVVLLLNRKLCVMHLSEILELSQPNVSKHLRAMRESNIVNTSQIEQRVYYEISEQFYKHKELVTYLTYMKTVEPFCVDNEKLLKSDICDDLCCVI